MGVQWSADSDYAKELAKWEAVPTEFVRVPGRPFVHREYPKWLYRASRADGGPKITDSIIVESDTQEAAMLSRGFHVDQNEAIEAIHAEDRQFAQLAAERAFAERRMSEKAQAEARIADESTPRHLPSVPETPIRTRRPYVRKVKE